MIDQENKRAERKETLGSVSGPRIGRFVSEENRKETLVQAMEGDVRSCHYCCIVRVAFFGLLRRQLNIIFF